MKSSNFNFKFHNQTKLVSPYANDNREVYHLWVNVNDLPSGFPTEVNPRDVKTNTKVYKKIKEGLHDSSESFFVNNRGLLISAKDLKVNKINKTVELDLGNEDEKDFYGVLDGGHTYHAVINDRKNLPEDITQFVHLEIMTNVKEIDVLSAARNTSVQVSDKAIAELAEKFDFVKESIEDEPYKNKIAYRENEDKPIDTVDLVRLLFAFNIEKYGKNSSSQPIQAYSGKAQVLKDYLNSYDNEDKKDNIYRKIAPLLPKITLLYDKIELEMKDGYRATDSKKKFGKVKGIEMKQGTGLTKYYNHNTDYQITQGFIFPIISAFRALLKEEDGKVYWEIDPLIVWEKLRSKLVTNTIEMYRQLGHNPQSTGKSAALWSQNFDAVSTAKLEMQLEELQNATKS